MDVPPLHSLVLWPNPPLGENVPFWKEFSVLLQQGVLLVLVSGRSNRVYFLEQVPLEPSHAPFAQCYLSVDHVSYGAIPVRIMVRPEKCHLKMDKLIFNKGYFKNLIQ